MICSGMHREKGNLCGDWYGVGNFNVSRKIPGLLLVKKYIPCRTTPWVRISFLSTTQGGLNFNPNLFPFPGYVNTKSSQTRLRL
jgi:hypothetical protein